MKRAKVHLKQLFTIIDNNPCKNSFVQVSQVANHDSIRYSYQLCVHFSPATAVCPSQSLSFLQKSSDVYLLDPSTKRFLSRINRGLNYIEAAKQWPDVYCKFKMLLLNNGKVAFQADNGKYLSRIAYSNNAVDPRNYIQPSKGSADYFSQFEYDYIPDGGPWEGAGTITLKSENGRYWTVSPSNGINYIKPLAKTPVKFIILAAR